MYEQSDSRLPDGRHESLWRATSETTDYESLDGNPHVDTAVVGGGIAGITTAAKLREEGQSVALFERDRILDAVTGHTTAKITSLHGMPYHYLSKRVSQRAARLYARANEAAIEDIAETVEESDIDCEFTTRTAYTYVTDPDQRRRIHKEVSKAKKFGLNASYVGGIEPPVPAAAAIAVENQASFHPRAYLLALAEEIPGPNSDIFEETRVTDVSDGTPCTVETDYGVVRADDVVIATHFPIVDKGLYFLRLRPKRSYVIAAEIAGEQPEGMYYCPEEPYFSIRPASIDDQELVLFGGANHRTGDGPSAEHYRDLEGAVREHFEVESVEYFWSTQDFKTPRGVPYIGELGPQTDHLYVATGFGGWGMTGGTVAGILLRDRILGRDNRWARAYSPSRLYPIAGIGEFISSNAETTRHMADRPLSRPSEFEAGALDAGEGDIFKVAGEKVAIYRDEDDELHAVSAICSHMGCQVSWNDAEKSWDCACHGSRFDIDGSVLDTPAVENLEQFDL